MLLGESLNGDDNVVSGIQSLIMDNINKDKCYFTPMNYRWLMTKFEAQDLWFLLSLEQTGKAQTCYSMTVMMCTNELHEDKISRS